MLGFLGPNGAGKTTTMRVLTGYMPPTDGKAIVAGYDIFDQPIEAKRRIGYLPETPPLYPEMTVRDYLTFVAEDQGSAETRSNCSRQRSHGAHRSRIWQTAIAASYPKATGSASDLPRLLHNPEVLILDEPTAGLDPKQIIDTRRLIKELGATTQSFSARTSCRKSARPASVS